MRRKDVISGALEVQGWEQNPEKGNEGFGSALQSQMLNSLEAFLEVQDRKMETRI